MRSRAINPATRVVYVDNDPVAVRFSRQLLVEEKVSGVAAIEADLRDPAAILAHPRTCQTLDLTRPVALLLVTVLHFIPDDNEAQHTLNELTAAVPSGSYLAIGHGTLDGAAEAAMRAMRLYGQTTHPLGFRPRAAVERFFAGFALVEPGLVYAPAWRPDDAGDPLCDEPGRAANWAGVGRKP